VEQNWSKLAALPPLLDATFLPRKGRFCGLFAEPDLQSAQRELSGLVKRNSDYFKAYAPPCVYMIQMP